MQRDKGQSEQNIRPVAIGIIQDQDKLLVFTNRDTVTGEQFSRPLGGGIEFGETGTQCIAREMREEIGAELTNVSYLGLIENIFTCDGKQGHEIVLVYRADLVNPAQYRQEPLRVDENGDTIWAWWVPLSDFESGKRRLVPEELLDMLRRNE